MGYIFRVLRADEIDVRVATVKESGVSLLLYKDARCDMNILDETVGAYNWERRHYECKGNLFCEVSIKEGESWVKKSDCGTESYTEKEKGEASDSFKRACFNWGIGRELYTAPFIWIPSGKCDIKKTANGKVTCYDKFKVKEIGYSDDRKINKLVIALEDTETSVFNFNEEHKQQEKSKIDTEENSLKELTDEMYSIATEKGFTPNEVTKLALHFFGKKPMEFNISEVKKLKGNFVRNADKLRAKVSELKEAAQ